MHYLKLTDINAFNRKSAPPNTPNLNMQTRQIDRQDVILAVEAIGIGATNAESLSPHNNRPPHMYMYILARCTSVANKLARFCDICAQILGK